MSEHKVEWYQGLVDELEEDFEERNTLFDEIDKMVRPEWSLPDDFSAVIKDVMAVIDTSPSDAINAGAIALSGSNPSFDVMPFMSNAAEYDRAQQLEDNITYHFHQSNRRGNGTVMYDIAESSLKYNTICVRVDDLTHIFPKSQARWTPMQKRAWGYGRFLVQAFNPKNVYYLETSIGISVVAHRQSFKVKSIMDHWALYANNETEEGKKVKSALTKLQNDLEVLEGQKYALKNVNFEQTYVIDDDKIVVYGSLTDGDGEQVTKDVADYVFADQKNEYGFIPWSIRVAGSRLEESIEYRVNPLLAPLYWSQSWDKLNLAKSIIYSEPIRRARNPRGVSITQSGDAPNVDYENGNEINLRTGEDYKPFQPMTMDENALQVVSALEGALVRTTGASILNDTTKISSNTPFSTFSAMIKVALSRLDKQRDIMAQSSTDIACMFLWWVDKTKSPLSSYAKVEKQYKSGTQVTRGTKIETTDEDYDLNNLGISSKVIPLTPTDKMEQLNMAVMLSTKLNVPVSQALEEIGYENVELMYELWAREFLQNAQLQAQAAAMLTEAQTSAQMGVQMQFQQMQQQQAQEQQGAGQPGMEGASPPGMMGAEQGMSQAAFGQMGGQEGFNPAIGGESPAAGAPGMTREAITGQTMNEGM